MNKNDYDDLSRLSAEHDRFWSAMEQLSSSDNAPTESPLAVTPLDVTPSNPNAGVEAELEAIADVLQNQAASMNELNLTQQEHGKSLKSQAVSQQTLVRELARESRNRAKSDKKYFWLGVVASFLSSITVQYLASLLTTAR